jgi:hypothetical protein
MGHGPALPSTEASGRCRFSQATFAGAHGNGRDAPIPDLPGITPEQGGSTQSRRSRGRDIDRLDPDLRWSGGWTKLG